MNPSPTQWTPPPHPKWVDTLNRLGRNLRTASALVPLDEDSLIAAAKSAAGGLSDFGDDAWRHPFRLLLTDIENSANLTLIGRLLARHDLVRSLVVRLKLAEAEQQQPQILQQPIPEPIFITGMGRTGTSILFELLSQDPALRTPAGWELRYPYFPSGNEVPTCPVAIEKTRQEVDLWTAIVPEFPSIHEIVVEEPDEDSVGHLHEFASPVWSALHHAPRYERWLLSEGTPQAFRFQRRLLQHLQWHRPGQWVLKAPAHLAVLPLLFAEFPDARVIQTHRDPCKVLASTANMMATLKWQRSDTVRYAEYAQTISFGYPLLLDMVIEQRQTGTVPNDRFVDVRYADLLAAHLPAIESIYQQLGLPLSTVAAAKMCAYLQAKPRGRHGSHDYSFAHLGVDEAPLRAQFANYMARFNVSQETL